ncbi:tetratricopeptide repeat protein [Pollutibacter soli]|uniref:tetratricopeptide repeat protein n=1 Tax=Pollutibacter soli TaxID=3034157 RepID=UPI0030131FC5
MATRLPVSGQISWPALIFNIVLMFFLSYISKRLGFSDPALTGIGTYIVVLFLLRVIITRDHRHGMMLVKRGKFAEAIPFFGKSYSLFSKHLWIDKYRFITLLSFSNMTYREMALNNIAFCYGQLGNGAKSVEYYEKTLAMFPENMLAKTALNLINAGKKL